jgi:hypothetical protein
MMIFTLEALDARHGDALLVHYGRPGSPHLAVVDGGPAGVYSTTLRPRLRELSGAHDGVDPLTIELVMVSHIDDDHIRGILDLTAELAERFEDHDPLPFAIRRLWLNSFDDIVGNQDVELFSTLTRGGAAPSSLQVQAPSRAVAASVPQGRRLRDDARKLAIPLNRPFEGLVARTDPGAPTIPLSEGVQLTVLAPSLARVRELQREWDTVLRRRGLAHDEALGRAAALLDDSVFNLSSVVVLARLGERTMLLTGDARGDDIIHGLEAAGLLTGGTLHVDVLKLPHHGSARNVDDNFFHAVTADHYVISANGRDGNPDLSTLRMLAAARPDDGFALHLTNRERRLEVHFEQERSAGRTYEVSFRGRRPSLRIDLAETLPL